MIYLMFYVENIASVIQVYNQIQVQSSASETGTFATVSGANFPINLVAGQTIYNATDIDGTSTTWYKSRYYHSGTEAVSSWSDPVLGEEGMICKDPTFPVEVSYGTSDQLVIDRIRRLVGDPVGLKREFDESDNIHLDGKIYEFEEKGWPCSININGTTYTSTSNPTVNGYKYLKFSEDITTLSGVDLEVDVFYYTFRNSDREIYETYNTCPPPAGLTTSTCTSEIYMLVTAIDLLNQETWEDLIENGLIVTDEASRVDPSPGLRGRDTMLERLQKRLDDLVKRLLLSGISGVLLD